MPDDTRIYLDVLGRPYGTKSEAAAANKALGQGGGTKDVREAWVRTVYVVLDGDGAQAGGPFHNRREADREANRFNGEVGGEGWRGPRTKYRVESYPLAAMSKSELAAVDAELDRVASLPDADAAPLDPVQAALTARSE